MSQVARHIRRSLAIGCLVFGSVALAPGGQPPLQDEVATRLGPKAYREGDVIEITNVTSTSPRLEQGDSLTVTGRVRLLSHENALLCLSVTQTASDMPERGDGTESIRISRGQRDFMLKLTIKHRGVLHVTMYDPSTGRPIGGTYFGTPEQMRQIERWSVAHYLAK